MPVTAASLPLHELLTLVAKEPPYWPNEQEELLGYAGFIPTDLWTSDPNPTSRVLRLRPNAAEKYVSCLNGMLQASVDGDLEHLTERDIKQSLWRFVSEAWLTRESLTKKAISERVELYTSSISQLQQDWEVLWEIDLLQLSEAIQVGPVEFFSLSEDVLDRQERPKGHPWSDIDKSLLDKAFARTIVRAGTREKAILRAKPIIDDALHILRVVISAARSVPHFQRLQERGMHYYAYLKDHPSRGGAGAERTSLQVSLGITGKLLEVVNRALDSYGPVLNDELAEGVREPVRRAIMAVGQGMARDDVDTRVLDLCSALEAILCTPNDRLKAEAIAVRYMLAGLAHGDDSYATHPLDIYNLYRLRNSIIHGSDRRVCTEKDYTDLRYVAKDAIERVITVAKNNPDVEHMETLFTRMETVKSLESVSSFLGNYAVLKDDAAKGVRRLTDWWLSRARLQFLADQHGFQLREIPQPREHQVVVFPIGAKMQKAIHNGTAVLSRASDLAQANQEANRLLQALVSDKHS